MLIKNTSLIRAYLPPGLFHHLGPSGSLAWAGSGDLQHLGRGRRGCLGRGCCKEQSLSPGEPGELQEAEQQHPATAGSAQGGGLEQTADAGITQTDVGGIPGRRGSLTTLGCI